MKELEDEQGRPHDGDSAEGWETFPVVGWEAEVREDWSCFMLRPHYLSKDHRDPASPLAGNRYVLSSLLCRSLAKLLLEAAEELENSPLSGSSGRAN